MVTQLGVTKLARLLALRDVMLAGDHAMELSLSLEIFRKIITKIMF